MGTWTLWVAFNAGVALFLLLDLGLFHRRAHAIALREAALESAVWVALSVAFGLWIFFTHGRGPGLEFFTGYVIEKSLSVDNVFVFLLIFQFFRVDPRYQHRLLFWGVLGALVMRGAMIGVGVILIQRFEWILYLFGAFLLYAGFKLFGADHSVHPEKIPSCAGSKRFCPCHKPKPGSDCSCGKMAAGWRRRCFLSSSCWKRRIWFSPWTRSPRCSASRAIPSSSTPRTSARSWACAHFIFLLAGILPYFRYLDEGLAIVLMFIGAQRCSPSRGCIFRREFRSPLWALSSRLLLWSPSSQRSGPTTPPTKVLNPWTNSRPVPPPPPNYIHRLARTNPEAARLRLHNIFSATGQGGFHGGSVIWKKMRNFGACSFRNGSSALTAMACLRQD